MSQAVVDNNNAGDMNDKDDDQITVENAEMNGSEIQTPKDDFSAPSAMTVHEQISTRNSVPWSLFVVPDDVERLVAALNPRGVRESALKQIISDQSSQISDFISRCDVDTFSGCQPPPSLTADSQKVTEQKLEKALREALLDLEERIFTGNLGNLKVIILQVYSITMCFSSAAIFGFCFFSRDYCVLGLVAGARFYRSDVVRVTNPAVSKH